MFKRKLYQKLLMSLLLTAFLAPPVHAETLTVADGTSNQDLGPIFGGKSTGFDKGTGYVEILYPKSLLTKEDNDMTGCNIKGITYYSNQFTFTGGTIEVQICETSNANWNSEISETLTTIATFSNVQNFYNSSTGMWTLDFGDNYFTYSGEQNLLIRINVTTKGSKDGRSKFYCNPTYNELGSSTTVIRTTYTVDNGYGNQTWLPKTTFTYEPATVAKYDAKVSPSALSFGSVQVDATSELSVALKNKGTNELTYTVSGLEAPFSTTVTSGTLAAGADDLSIPVTFAPIAAGAFEDDLVITFGSETGLDPITVHITGTGSDAICDGGATNQYLPVYGFYYDYYPEVNQMVYPASKLEKFIGKKITGMTFYPATYTSYSTTYSGINFSGGSVTFKLANLPSGTTPFASSNATRIVPENITTVKTFAPVADASATEWVIKEFTNDVDFVYDGGDLLIEVVTEKGDDGYTYFYGETTEDNRSFYSYGSTGNGQSFLPKVTFAVEAAVPQVKVTPAELTFGGENFAYGSTDTKTFKVTNTTDDDVDLLLNDGNNVFTVEPAKIEAGAINAVVTVKYSPAAAGTHTAKVKVGDKEVTLTGTAVEPNIEGTVTPTELSFRAYVNQEATQQITIANTGNTAFTPVFSTLEAPFSIEAASKIDVGESKNFNVTYHPTELDIHSGTLKVSINNNVTDVTLSGISSIQGDDVTVADGTDESYVVPFYGYFADIINVYGQMIYPASELKNLVGKDINAIKFYSSTGIQFSEAKYDVTIGTTNLNEFSGTQRVAIPDGVTASVTPAKNAPEIEITFSEPFRYHGGNLIIDTYGIMSGTCDSDKGDTKYYGVNQTTNTAINSRAEGYGTPGYAQFLPKITFSVSEPAATDIATLKELCLNGEANKKYTIKESLRAAYKKGNTVWFKDDNKFASKDEVVEPQNNFEIQFGDKVWNSKDDFDQSNWIEVVFPENLFPGELLHPNTDLDTEYPFVMVKNLTGTFTKENGNPKLEVLMAVTSSDVTETEQYDPNLYSPANFVGTQKGHYLKDGNTVNCDYFFVKPKPQEFAKILYAVYSNGTLTMTENQNGVSGTVSVDLSKNSGTGTGLVDGNVYSNFDVIICIDASSAPAPAPQGAPMLKAQGDSYKVYPLNLSAAKDVTTAISTVGVNGEVKSVKYVSVAGLVSDRPFEGVNIVVTEYTDGSRTTTKMVK